MSKQFDKLLLHPATAAQLSICLKSRPHAILVSGQVGAGKTTLAKQLSSALLEITSENLSGFPYFTIVSSEAGKEISIDQIRQIIKSLQLRVPSSRSVQRIVLIDNAQNMSQEAQNATLKILEEPPPGTIFILTALSKMQLLPTISSRTQQLFIRPVGLNAAVDFFSGSYETADITKAWHLSQGGAGLMSLLLASDEKHELVKSVESAKNFLQASSVEKVITVSKLAADKQKFKQFLNGLSRVLGSLHYFSLQKNNLSQASSLLKRRKIVNQSVEALKDNVAPKLIASRLLTGFDS